MLAILAIISAFVLSTPLYLFLIAIVVLGIGALYCVIGKKENRLWVLWTVLMCTLLCVRLQMDWKHVLIIFVGNLVLGIGYSFYRWRKETRNLTEVIAKSVAKTSWPMRTGVVGDAINASGIRFDNVFLHTADSAEFDQPGTSRKYTASIFNNEDEVWAAYEPSVNKYRTLTLLWILFWFVYVLGNLTDMLLDSLGGVYRRIIKSNYGKHIKID